MGGGDNSELSDLVSRVKNVKNGVSKKVTEFAFTVDELNKVNYENSQVGFVNGKLARKPGFKVGNCDLYILNNKNKPVKIPDKTITLLAKVVSSGKVVGYKCKFMGRELKLALNNIVILSSIFKPVDYTVAVRDVKTTKENLNTGKVEEVSIKKPYLVGINGNRLSELPEEVIESKKETKPKKELPSLENKEETATKKKDSDSEVKKSIVDVNEKIFKYSGNLALYDFMKTLQDAKCAIVTVDETEKSLAKGIASFCGLEVALPRLICKDSYDLMLDYKRIGIAKLKNKNFIIYKDIYRHITKNFKTKANLTVVCTKESLSTLGNIIGNNDNSVISLDKRVGSIIKSLLGAEFNTSNEMVYFNVCVDNIPFGSSRNKNNIYNVDKNAFWDMQHRYFKNRYTADILHYYWNYHFKERNDDVNERFSELYKAKSPLLGKLKSIGVDLGYGCLKGEDLSQLSAFRIYDTRGDFKFFATGKSYYTDMAQVKAETEELDKDKIDGIFINIGERILDEITDEPAGGLKVAKGMSGNESDLVCAYELEYAAAFAFCHKIFKNGSSENKFTLNNYLRDKYEEHNSLANEALLEIVDLMANSYTADEKIAVGNKFKIHNGGNTWRLSGMNCGFIEGEFNEIITSIEPINSELSAEDITSKENSKPDKVDSKTDKSVSVAKKSEEGSQEFLIDTSANMIKYTGELPLFDFMDYLKKMGCALAFVDSPKKAISKEVSDFYGLEVTLPNLVCRESFDILLRYQRIGIVDLPSKSKVLVNKPVERFIFKDFEAVGSITIVCSVTSSDRLSKLIDTTKANRLDAKVATVIKSLLGNKFKLGKEMCYFNVDISEMKFGSKKGTAFKDTDYNSASKMIYDYLEAYIKRDMIDGIWSDSGIRDKENIHPMYFSKSKDDLDSLLSKGVELESGIIGKADSLQCKNNIISIRDKAFPFKFRMLEYTGYIVNTLFRDEALDKEKTIENILDYVVEKMDYEITELGVLNNYAAGMSDDDQHTYCFYGAHREAACDCLGYVYKNNKNRSVLNNYFRNKLNDYTETANTTFLRILDSLYKSGQGLTAQSSKRALFLGTLFE